MASDVRSPYISDSACFWSKPTPSRDAPCDMHVTVRDPRTHVKDMRAQYTDYKIETEGSSDIMPLGACTVRRRYSEFTWLRKKLAEEFSNASIPPLPGNRVLGRFDTEFIRNRQQGLEHWLRSIYLDLMDLGIRLGTQGPLDVSDNACFWSSPPRGATCDMHVTVRDPRTHVKGMRAQYTDYKIETEDSTQTLGACTVRRRYSEFAWLRKKLVKEFPNASIPPLPGKRVFGRFNTEFIKNRQEGLEQWLRSLLSNTYKENAYLQLFLQTDLDIGDIQKCLRDKDRQDLYHVILLTANHRHNNNNNRSSRYSTADSAIDSSWTFS
ncbi:uncharacterized protein LOC5511988 isoform X3 [Nematostella vectensis]|uniref:uncharacterized protein LOC5511988 isoform X3 n=1 Tax=Nematostella vectensis TaxID=45351 RepID=UPI002077488B|nr:uncharacterized protein LOC5511988 isoform X3 [Nematostella vectensis]